MLFNLTYASVIDCYVKVLYGHFMINIIKVKDQGRYKFVIISKVHLAYSICGEKIIHSNIPMQVSLTENIAMSKCCMDTNSVAKCACRLAIINLDYLQARGILFEFRWAHTFIN